MFCERTCIAYVKYRDISHWKRRDDDSWYSIMLNTGPHIIWMTLTGRLKLSWVYKTQKLVKTKSISKYFRYILLTLPSLVYHKCPFMVTRIKEGVRDRGVYVTRGHMWQGDVRDRGTYVTGGGVRDKIRLQGLHCQTEYMVINYNLLLT